MALHHLGDAKLPYGNLAQYLMSKESVLLPVMMPKAQ